MKHCWHHTGTVRPMYPPIYEVFCCWCNTTGVEKIQEHKSKGCGPFAPTRWVVKQPEGECPERKEL